MQLARSTCSESTDFDSNMALFSHDGVLMVQNDDASAACGGSWNWGHTDLEVWKRA